MSGQKTSSRWRSGFSLIELLVVLVIIAILSALAIPQYRTMVDRTRRSSAEYAMSQCMRGLFLYQTDNDSSSFPTTDMIASYEDLADVIAPYIGAPASATDAKFTFMSYTGDDTSFTLVGKALDSNRSTITGTHRTITITP